MAEASFHDGSEESQFLYTETTPRPAQAANDVALLQQAVLTERSCPDVLAYQGDLIERIKMGLGRQERITEELGERRATSVEAMLLSTETMRVRYLLKSYHRSRILKIEKLAGHILDRDQEYIPLLAQHEVKHCHNYFVKLAVLMKSVTDDLPGEFSALVKQSRTMSETNDMLPQPRLDSHVFLRLLQDVGTVRVDDEGREQAEMSGGDLYIVRYAPVAHLVKESKACLV